MKKIAVDAMGGDNAPQALVEGVNQAIRDFDDIEIVLYGDEAKIKNYLTATERVSIVHTEEKIDSDDEPARAIRRKKQASMVLAAKDVKAGEVDAMLSAGNTGALLAAGFFIVGRIKGVERPGLMSTLPTVDGRGYDMLDLGANAENTPEHLHQYAVMGSYYAENVRGIQKPRAVSYTHLDVYKRQILLSTVALSQGAVVAGVSADSTDDKIAAQDNKINSINQQQQSAQAQVDQIQDVYKRQVGEPSILTLVE